jgi:hypothetical protein
MELEVFFTIIQQTYSKLVISFMNRKSSCGYATHFLYLISKKFVLFFQEEFQNLFFFLSTQLNFELLSIYYYFSEISYE